MSSPITSQNPEVTNPISSYDNDKRLQTLSTILELQQLEKQLYTNLESISTNTSPESIAKQQQIVSQINELSKTRINLFNTVNDLYQFAQDNVSENRTELVDKMTVAKVMENQLDNMKDMLNELEQLKNNKLRMVQINTYYGKQYQGQTDLMKLIIKICVVVILLITLSKTGILPQFLVNTLTVLVIGVGAFFVFRKISDLSSRDNMDFDRYETQKMASKDLATTYDDSNLATTYDDSNADNKFFGMSDWSVCGEGTMFDTDKGQCVVEPIETFSTMNNELRSYNDNLKQLSCPMKYN